MLPRCYSIVIDWSGTIEPFPHSAPHNRAIVYTGSWLLLLNAESWQGKSPSAYINAIYSTLAVIKGSKFGQLGLSGWKNLISCKVDYQCLVLTNSWSNLVGVIHTRGQYIRSHSTGEDFISLIVAVFLSEQLKAVWLKFGVLDFCRKRLIGVGSTLTFVEKRPRYWSTLTFFGKDFTQSS